MFYSHSVTTQGSTNSPSNTSFIKVTFDDFKLQVEQHDQKKKRLSKIITAKLRVYLNQTHSGILQIVENLLEEAHIDVVVHRINHVGDVHYIQKYLAVHPEIRHDRIGWIEFDIRQALPNLQNGNFFPFKSHILIHFVNTSIPETNFEGQIVGSSEVSVQSEYGFTNHVDTLTHEEQKYHQRTEPTYLEDPSIAHIDIVIRERVRHRRRRSIINSDSHHHLRRSGTNCQQDEDTCCRLSRDISFAADLGWGYWIAYPDHYTMFYCNGSCPQGHRFGNAYATIKSQMSLMDPAHWDPPCCTASRLGDLPVIMMTVNGLQEAVMEKVVVEECMCL